MQRRYRDVESLERREYGYRRRYGAIPIDQRGAEQPERHDERPLVFLQASSDMSARIPPSPSLPMLIAMTTYLTVVTTINVQMTSDSVPRMTSGSVGPR